MSTASSAPALLNIPNAHVTKDNAASWDHLIQEHGHTLVCSAVDEELGRSSGRKVGPVAVARILTGSGTINVPKPLPKASSAPSVAVKRDPAPLAPPPPPIPAPVLPPPPPEPEPRPVTDALDLPPDIPAPVSDELEPHDAPPAPVEAVTTRHTPAALDQLLATINGIVTLAKGGSKVSRGHALEAITLLVRLKSKPRAKRGLTDGQSGR